MNSNLKLVRVQYRPVGAGEWVSARSDDSAEDDKKKTSSVPTQDLMGVDLTGM